MSDHSNVNENPLVPAFVLMQVNGFRKNGRMESLRGFPDHNVYKDEESARRVAEATAQRHNEAYAVLEMRALYVPKVVGVEKKL